MDFSCDKVAVMSTLFLVLSTQGKNGNAGPPGSPGSTGAPVRLLPCDS